MKDADHRATPNAIEAVASYEIDAAASYDIQQLRKRDRQAFRQAYDAYIGLLLYTAVRMGVGRADANDIAQDVFVKLWECVAQIENMGALKAWLVVSTRNRAIDYLRQQKNTRNFGHEPLPGEGSNAADVAHQNEHIWREIQVSLVGDIVDELCAESNETSFRRFYVDGKSSKEIAAENAEPISTVTNRLSRMRKTFKIKFSERLRLLRDGNRYE